MDEGGHKWWKRSLECRALRPEGWAMRELGKKLTLPVASTSAHASGALLREYRRVVVAKEPDENVPSHNSFASTHRC